MSAHVAHAYEHNLLIYKQARLLSELTALLDNASYVHENLSAASSPSKQSSNSRVHLLKSPASIHAAAGKSDSTAAAAAMLNLEQVFSSLHNNAVTLNNVPDWLRCCDADLADLVEMRQFDDAVRLLQRFRSTPVDVIETHPDHRRITRNIQRTESILVQRLTQAFVNCCSCTMFGGIAESFRHADALRALNLEYQTCTVYLQVCWTAITEALTHSSSSYNTKNTSTPTKASETTSSLASSTLAVRLENEAKITFSEINRSYKKFCELGFGDNAQCMTAYLSWGQFSVCSKFADDVTATLANYVIANIVLPAGGASASGLDLAANLQQCVQLVADCIDRVIAQTARVQAFDCELVLKQAITERMKRHDTFALLSRQCEAQIRAISESDSTHWTGIKFQNKAALARYLDQIVRVGLPSVAKYTHAESCTVLLPKALIDVSRVMLKVIVMLPRCMPACMDAQHLVEEQLNVLARLIIDYVISNVVNEYKKRPTELVSSYQTLGFVVEHNGIADFLS